MARQLRFDLEPYLFIGDNLPVLQTYVADESVDLVYLDPPFNSNKTYNIFKRVDGSSAAAQIRAFDDTWRWSEESVLVFRRTVEEGGPVGRVLRAFQDILGPCDMLAYLTMMAPRLMELRRVLKPTGSLYLHCDQTASHYLKILLDGVFGQENFRNDIIWKRKAGRGETNKAAVRFGVTHDDLLFYSKTGYAPFRRQYRPNNPAYLASKFVHLEEGTGRRYRLDNLTSPSYRANLRYEYEGYAPPEKGWAVSLPRMKEMHTAGRLYFPKNKAQRIQRKRYLDELEGETVDSLWDDIPPINSRALERVGYPTQKPTALLERIIAASTEPDGLVLDPFCGCGTAIDAAQSLGRRWIGVDVTEVALNTIEHRLERRFPGLTYTVRFMPTTADELRVLADRDKYAFQQWVCDRLGIDADIRKGADKGIDGEKVKYTIEGRPWRAIVSVKGGGVNVTQIRDLRGTMERESADGGIFVSYRPPTGPMRKEALAAGLTPEGIPRIQLVEAVDLIVHPETAVRFPVVAAPFGQVEEGVVVGRRPSSRRAVS